VAELECFRGDDNIYNLTVVRNNAAVNIFGAKIWFTAKHDQDDMDAQAVIRLDSVTNPTQVAITNAASGLALVALRPVDTAGLDETALWYDVQMKESSGRVTTIVSGIMKITKDVTTSVA
jgi:hypothetical protein